MCKDIPDCFISLEACANLNEVEKKDIKFLINNNTYGNEKRFKEIDGKIYVHQNYRAIYKEELEKLFYKALIIARTQTNLAREISKISDLKQHTLERYFIRFTFKQIAKAEKIIHYIKNYVTQNSLFGLEELTYAD